MSCPDCFAGHIHEGKPRGQITKIHDLDTYVSEPAAGAATKGIIVFIPDAFGLDFINNRLLADHYADQGYKVYLPDFMEGHCASIDVIAHMRLLQTASILAKPYYIARVLGIFVPFLWYNRMGLSNPRVKAFLEKLRTAEGPNTFIGTAGFCWGAKHIHLLCHNTTVTVDGKEMPLFDAGFIAHPSFYAPSDIDDPITVPLSYALAEKDQYVTAEVVAKIKDKIESLPAPVTGEVVFYKGVTHGFCVRADSTADEAKEADAAAVQAIAWFDKHLAK